MKFIDRVELTLASGKGGPGSIAYRREKFVPRGGPDGGDGGRGGDVIFRVNPRLNSLLEFRFTRRMNAENGQQGAGGHANGYHGADLILEVPPGTQIKNREGELLHDLQDTVDFVFLKGGRGGKGNAFFKTSVNQAPDYAQPGELAQEMNVVLELKLIADVGIVGFPNAGKSTLISQISAARPKIADYPFTTLVPQLGVVSVGEGETFVVADIPGLIEGASVGVGLGYQFLRHIERTRLFLHLVDVSGMNGRTPVEDFEVINRELLLYDQSDNHDPLLGMLSQRPQIVVLNKMDVLTEEKRVEAEAPFRARGFKVNWISAATGQGVKELIRVVYHQLEALKDEEKKNG